MSRGISLSVGDRELPLEVNLESDTDSSHELTGSKVRVSPIAGGELLPKRGEIGKIEAVISRLGQVSGYQVSLEKDQTFGTKKDFFVGKEVLEDIQPETPTSVSLREGLSHWAQQRTYWHTRLDGLESFCFHLASITPRVSYLSKEGGWIFVVPEPMPGRYTAVDCSVALHGNFWTLATMIYPIEGDFGEAPLIENHWARTFTWADTVAQDLLSRGAPWEEALRKLRARANASAVILEPMVQKTLQKVIAAKKALTGDAPYYKVEDVVSAFSYVRLKPGFVGLTEPPSDRRPYTVVSISPRAAEKYDYLQQVVLHECLHIAVESKGGDPHNDEFNQLAQALGLKEEYRD